MDYPGTSSGIGSSRRTERRRRGQTEDGRHMARGFIKQQLTSSQVADVRASLLLRRCGTTSGSDTMSQTPTRTCSTLTPWTISNTSTAPGCRRLREQLAPSAFTLNEYYFAARLVLSMPASWRTTISTINQSHTATTLTVSAVSAILLKEENLRKTLQAPRLLPSLLLVKQRPPPSSPPVLIWPRSTGPPPHQSSIPSSHRTLVHAAHIASTLDTLLPSAMRRTAVGL